MGVYIYIDNYDKKRMKNVTDEDVNEAYNEAIKYDPTLLVSESTEIYYRKICLFLNQRKTKTVYKVYSEVIGDDGQSLYQAEQIPYATGNKRVAIAFFKGVSDLGRINDLRKKNG